MTTKTSRFFSCHKLSWHNCLLIQKLEISNKSIQLNLYVHLCDFAAIVEDFLVQELFKIKHPLNYTLGDVMS